MGRYIYHIVIVLLLLVTLTSMANGFDTVKELDKKHSPAPKPKVKVPVVRVVPALPKSTIVKTFYISNSELQDVMASFILSKVRQGYIVKSTCMNTSGGLVIMERY